MLFFCRFFIDLPSFLRYNIATEVMAVGPMILCVGVEKGKMLRLSMLCAALGIQVKEANEQQLGMKLGQLCGLDPLPEVDKPGKIKGEMLVMAGFEGKLMDQFLMGLRQNGCPVPLKAVLTLYNRHWKCEKLYDELTREALSFANRSKNG